MSDVKKICKEYIKNNKIMIFSKTTCPYCTDAKKAAQDFGVPVEVVELDKRPDGAAIQEHLKKQTKQGSVPNIFVKGKHVGGCDDFIDAKAAGKIHKLLGIKV